MVPSTEITNTCTILGFGSLLSEKSSRSTFANLKNFRLGRVENYRRVFGHAPSFFFEINISNMETKEMASLSVEPCDGAGFVCSVFEVPNDGLMEIRGSSDEIFLSDAFRLREEEFDFAMVPYKNLEETAVSYADNEQNAPVGVLCTRSTDEAYITMWGEETFERKYKSIGLETIWCYDEGSGLRPCAIYMRHCVLAARNMGDACYNSFLDETYLVDRKTTVRAYLEKYPNIMTMVPPPELTERYGG
mmetsp:Transcript_25812/g.40026  ORF Transcript_25812/g.40026 Transcript_25812/m.40026 type:complete len:247 (-) Transcript_25812:856-1596(-)